MRLFVDCHVFDGKFQGTRTYLQGIYTNLVNHKDVDFYFAAQNLDNLRTVFGDAENIHYVQLSNGGGLKRLFVEIPQIIKEYQIDYAHYQYISPWKKCCKEIVTCHDLLFLDMPQYFPLSFRLNKGFFFKRSAKRADVLLTVSKFSKSELVRHYGLVKDKIYITPNAVLPAEENIVLPDVKSAWGLDKYIMTVSRIEPRKNHLSLLKAFVELKLYEKSYKLVMVGSPDIEYKEFQDYLHSLPNDIQDSVVIKLASFPELVALYRNASLFVFPSLAEGFGIPPLEALEYGCPLLCSNATAMAEFDFPKEIFFDPQNFDELKTKINRELQNPTNLASTRKHIKEIFDWPVISENFYNLLKKQPC